MDSLYHPDLKDWQIRSKFDPCIYIFQQPTGFQAARIWQQGQIPLWNPNASAGQPIMANIESGIFSLSHYLFPVQSEYLYNLGIVCKLIAASLGVFALARLLQVSPIYSALAALAFSFCPYIIREVELTKETWIYPWILNAFVACTRRMSLWRASLLGGYCGYLCATIHPECSFNTIVLSSLFVLIERSARAGEAIKDKLRGLVLQIIYLAGVGLIALATCSPVLLAFAEYMRNSDCYKFENVVPPTVPIKAFCLALLNPVLGGNSPYLGVMAIPLVLTGIFAIDRKSVALYSTLIFSILVMTAFGPFQWLFTIAPFNHLEPIYVQPWAFMLMSVAIAQTAQKIFGLPLRKLLLSLIAVTLCVAISPFVLKNIHGLFDGLVWDAGMEAFAINVNAARRDLMVAIGAIVAICFVFVLRRNAKVKLVTPYLLGAIVLCLGLFSELSIARNAMPTHAPFNFPAPDAIVDLQRDFAKDRMVATGRHLMLPNINCVWDLSDFRSFNGLYPPRFLSYQKNCGARKYYATHFRYEDGLTRFTDLAAIKTILSRSVVWGAETADRLAALDLSSIATLDGGHKVFASGLMQDAKNAAVLANIRIEAPPIFLAHYASQYVALDHANREVWVSDIYPMQFYMANDDSSKADLVAHWCVPANHQARDLKYMVRFSHNLSYAPVFPLSTVHGQLRNLIACGDASKLQALPSGYNDRFALTKQYPDGLRIYRATQALPAAFMAFDARPLKDQSTDAQAFAAAASSDFDPHRQVIVEDYKGQWCNSNSKRSILPVVVQRPHANRVVMETNDAGLLVLNDTCYPGWQATVDGVETPIYRANTYFRAVEIPSGRHTVAFEYKPKSFQRGLYAFAICWAVLILLNLLMLFKRFRPGRSYQPLT